MGDVRTSAVALAEICSGDFSVFEDRMASHLLSLGLALPSPGERRSWRGSLPVLARDLVDAGLGDFEVIVEHRLPLSSRRIDAVLAGHHPRTGKPSFVVVELKQWSGADLWEGSDTLVDVAGAPYRLALHPGVQVAGYVDYLRDFIPALSEDPDMTAGVAYLHNATDYSVSDRFSPSGTGSARVFTGQRRHEFHDFLRSRLAPVSGIASPTSS